MTIFLDLDGTILDIQQRHYRCYADIVYQLRGKPLDIHTYWSHKRNMIPRDVTLKESYLENQYDDFLKAWYAQIEKPEYLQYDVLKPKVIETLNLWKKKYARDIFLVTMRHNRQTLLAQLKNLAILDFFSEVVDCNPKDVDGKYTALCGRAINNAVFIGDTEIDIQTARKLDIPSIAVTSGLREKQYLDADYYVDEINKIDFSKNLLKKE